MKRSLGKGFILLFFFILGVLTGPVLATDFPTRPVTLIVPWTAGGPTDVCLRILAETTKKHLGQPVIIENKPGGGGTVGPATMAATAKPDGYTISQIPLPVFRYPLMMKTTWDPLKDFAYIIHLTGYTFGVIVKKDAPWKTFNELVAYAKANSGKVTYATPGAGTSLHTTMEMIALKKGFKWTQVPMKGSSEACMALLGGHVMATASLCAPQVDSGDLRLLVTWGEERTKKWPSVPTLKELGYGMVSNSPFGIAGPKGMDPKVIKILHDAFKKGLHEPTFQNCLDKYDMEIFYMNSEKYRKYVEETYDDEKEIVEKLGLKSK
jgi:tripartite-type tricarboxylate transporter receptor subunit TctC